MKLYWDNQTDMDAALKTTNNKGFDIILGADIMWVLIYNPLPITADLMLFQLHARSRFAAIEYRRQNACSQWHIRISIYFEVL